MKTNKPLVALVTGGNRGIGFEDCRQLAKPDHPSSSPAATRRKDHRLVPMMRANGFGRIVNESSGYGAMNEMGAGPLLIGFRK